MQLQLYESNENMPFDGHLENQLFDVINSANTKENRHRKSNAISDSQP